MELRLFTDTDLLIPHLCSVKDAALDFTVVNPLQEGGSAVEHAHKGKCRKYEERCAAEGITFLPLAVDTLGGWHSADLETINGLGRQVARNVGREGQEMVGHLRQRLSVLMVRDNVAMLCARTPTYPSPKVDRDPDQ